MIAAFYNKRFFTYIIFTLVVLAAMFYLIPIEAFAQEKTTDDVTKVICKVIGLITGGIGKAIAILIVISLAIALFLGKVTWGLAIAVMVGIGVLFGAEYIVSTVTPGGTPGEKICKPEGGGTT